MKIIGLLNLGNTCYVNSVLQCFLYDPLFQKILIENKNVINNLLFDIISNIDLTENNEKLIVPYNLSKFLDYFISKKSWFIKFQQNDSHDFLTNFLDLLCNPQNLKLSGNDPDILWNIFLKNNDSPFTDIYHGQTKTSIKCCNCNSVSVKYEEFNTINLSINGINNLTELFINYLRKEIQDDPKNLYYCETCKCQHVSEKKIAIYRLPPRLILVLKKYSKKNNILINNFLIKEQISSEIKKYKLSGIVNHSGNLHDGHYTSNVLINNNWYYFNDHVISLQNTMKFNNQDAYILFFSAI